MKRLILLGIGLGLVLLVISGGVVLGQREQSPGEVRLAGPVGTGFTYQGELVQSDGTPVDGACDCAPRHAAWDTRLNREKFGGDFWANRPTLKRKPKRKTACR